MWLHFAHEHDIIYLARDVDACHMWLPVLHAQYGHCFHAKQNVVEANGAYVVVLVPKEGLLIQSQPCESHEQAMRSCQQLHNQPQEGEGAQVRLQYAALHIIVFQGRRNKTTCIVICMLISGELLARGYKASTCPYADAFPAWATCSKFY